VVPLPSGGINWWLAKSGSLGGEGQVLVIPCCTSSTSTFSLFSKKTSVWEPDRREDTAQLDVWTSHISLLPVAMTSHLIDYFVYLNYHFLLSSFMGLIL